MGERREVGGRMKLERLRYIYIPELGIVAVNQFAPIL